MKNLFKAIAYEHLKLHGILFLLLLVAAFTQKTLGGDIFNFSLSSYVFVCFIFFLLKYYCSRNWSWLKTLPISRLNLLSLVLFDSLIVVPLGMSCFLGSNFFVNSHDFSEFSLWSILHGLSRVISAPTAQHWTYLILFSVGCSPILIFIAQPMTVKSFGWNYNAKTIFLRILVAGAIAIAFYFSPVLIGIAVGAFFVGTIGSYSLKLIFPQRKFQKWTRLYGVIAGLSICAIIVLRVEMSSEKEMRPALRMKYYGFLAPGIDRSRLFTLLAKSDITDESRLEVANFEKSRSPTNKLVISEDLKEWSENAKSNRVFLQGLTLFADEIWTPQTLIQLEKDLQDRCKEGLQSSKWAPVWRCELNEHLLDQQNGPLKLQFSVKNEPAVVELLTTAHPLISSMLIQTSLISDASDLWKEKIEGLVKAKIPVVSNQAQMWLDRRTLNSKADWDCSKSRKKKDSVCTEVDTIGAFGLKIESKEPNDPGGSISIKLVR